MVSNSGKDFEGQIKESVEKIPSIYYYRLRDSASSFNPTKGKGVRFTPKNDYDSFMFQEPNFFPVELKSKKGTGFSFPRTKEDKDGAIKLNQILGLSKASKTKGVYAGFLFNFSTKARTYWMDIRDFLRFSDESDKKSINEKDIIEYGGIKVEQTLKKVKYTFDIQKMIDDIRRIKGKEFE